MILSLRNTITNTYYVFGIPELPSVICIEEQNTITKASDGEIEEIYDYYIFSPWYGDKMYMYGTASKCMPTEEIIKKNFEIYKENFMQE